VAARRRPGARGGDEAARPAKKAGKAGRAAGARGGKGPSGILRLVKLGVLVGAFLVIGFFAVLVVDVGMSLVGKVRLGETTVTELWDKVVDRVLDRDVPKAPDPPKAQPRPAKPAPPPKPVTAERAPLPAARPEDDARHVEERPAARDPEVEQARRRLDEILGRL
jgi:type IV secretory pathway VirB10-like protein